MNRRPTLRTRHLGLGLFRTLLTLRLQGKQLLKQGMGLFDQLRVSHDDKNYG